MEAWVRYVEGASHIEPMHPEALRHLVETTPKILAN
jgi:hypothetical protein